MPLSASHPCWKLRVKLQANINPHEWNRECGIHTFCEFRLACMSSCYRKVTFTEERNASKEQRLHVVSRQGQLRFLVKLERDLLSIKILF